MPVAGVAAPQQQTDINKPTRERVKAADKKSTAKKDDKAATVNKKDDKSSSKNKKDDKSAVANKKDDKNTATKKDDKNTATKKDDKNSSTKKDDKNTATKKEDKVAATVKKDDKAAAPVKAADKKNVATTPVADVKAGNPVQDTTAKPVKKTKQPKPNINTETTQFDGIDVSKHQEYINWAELRNNKRIQYVYIRATVGSDVQDSRYKENVRNARKNGFKVGSYHYMTNLSSVHSQFENFRKMVDKSEQDLLPMIDIEENRAWKKQQLRDSLLVFAQLIEDYYGVKPLIYTYEIFYKDNLGVAFENYPLFIAKYSNQQPYIGPKAKWIMWQFADCGYFPAVKGNRGQVDLSRFNTGCSINDILYRPAKSKPKASVKDAVDYKEKPDVINATEQKSKETTKASKASTKASNKQKAEEQKKAEKEAKVKERKKKLDQEEAEKKAKEQAEAEKKAKQRAEHQKREKERQEAAQKAAEEKAKRKAAAKKARDEQAKQQTTKGSSKSANVQGAYNSKMTQSQRNDSIRAAKQKGRKINQSSADND